MYKVLDLYGHTERIPLTVSLQLTSEIHSRYHVSFYLKKDASWDKVITNLASLTGGQSFNKSSSPFQTLMFYRKYIFCHTSESPDYLHTITLSPSGGDRRKPLFQALLGNLKEHNALPHLPSQNTCSISRLGSSIILKVHLRLCLRPVSAYNPKVTVWWITLDSIS